MSLAANTSEREKYYQLLQLAQDQIKALEMDDLFEFDRIMAVKDDVIRSMGDSTGLLDVDPALANVCAEIQDRDKTAMRLLFDRLGRLKRQISELNQYQTARNAYRVSAQQLTEQGRIFANGAPRFLDRKT
jgi:hypothetical protein